MIANLLSGAGGVVLGTILGFLLTLGATGWQKSREKNEQKDAVFMLLRIEIDQNLAALTEYWKKSTTNFNSEHSYDKEYQSRMRYLDNLPGWRHQRWESLTPLLAATLKEQEIKKVEDFHAHLDDLAASYSKLKELLPPDIVARYEERNAQPQATRRALFLNSSLTPFEKELQEYIDGQRDQWHEYEAKINDLLQAKKPLEAPTPTSTRSKLSARLKGRLPGKRQHKQP